MLDSWCVIPTSSRMKASIFQFGYPLSTIWRLSCNIQLTKFPRYLIKAEGEKDFQKITNHINTYLEVIV